MGRRLNRILMVLDHSFPTDVRVENEACSLIDAGFEVGLLAIGPDTRPPRDEYRGIHIFRDRIPESVRNKMRGLAGTVPLYEEYLARRIRKVNAHFPFDALHLHDLYLFGGGLQAAKRLNVPVVGDLHENWVEALRGYEWSNRFPARALISFSRWEKLERRWTRAVDRLVVVIEEAAERNVRNGVDPENIVVVPNTLSIDAFEELGSSSVEYRSDGETALVYAGGVDRHRGLETVVDAMPAVLGVERGVRLHIVGDGRTRTSLEDRCRRLGLEDSVVFHGWRPLQDVRGFIRQADVCLIPHLRSPHTDATIPHKLFQYMYCSRPVLVSDCRPLARIVNEVECGAVFRAGDASSFAEQLSSLLSTRDTWGQLGGRGRTAVIEKYNWQQTVGSLVDAYRSLLGMEEEPEATL
ncbi:MAG: glycosyltransferase family 4 protein [Rhodothermales bacterium]|nr:glycosyltransferase family 4 protein [Rhodothermales bacterium]